ERQPGRDDEAEQHQLTRRREQLDPARQQHGRERVAKDPVAHLERQLAADQNAWDRSDQEPADRTHVDVPGDKVPGSRDPEQRGGMEDVSADNLSRPQRKENQERQTEEHAGPDGRQADNETAEEPDPHRGQAVTPFEEKVPWMLANGHEAFREEPGATDQQRDAEHGAPHGLGPPAVAVLEPSRKPDTDEPHGCTAEEHPAREPRCNVAPPPELDRFNALED